MSGLLIVVGLGAWVAFFLFRVRVERGWVGWRPLTELLEEWNRAFTELERIVGAAFVPALEDAATKMVALAEAFTAVEIRRGRR